MEFYQLKITRKGTKPPVWRRCLVPADTDFAKLAAMLEDILEYADTENYEFEFFQKKLRLQNLEAQTTEATKGSYEYAEAKGRQIAELLDTEAWFTFRVKGMELPEYRTDIEKKITDEEKAGTPEILKETRSAEDDFWTADMQTKNTELEKKYGALGIADIVAKKLAEMYNPDKFTPATIEFVDIAGLVKGASQGEGLGNKFLSHIREVDAIIHVVRCFENDDITHVDGSVDPARDIDTINLELVLSDLDILTRRIDSRKKAMKGDKKLAGEVEFLERLAGEMENGKTARSVEISEEEQEYLKDVSLLTIKPVIYACNMGENDFIDGIDNNKYYKAVEEIAKAEGAETLPICAEMEAEIAQLDDEEKAMFLADMGLEKSGLDRLIKKSYSLLGLISYLTAGKPEVRAWTIKKGTKAPQAAGKIHTDFERGFIRAEVVSFDDLMACGSMAAAKEKGLVRSEGKEYVMKDGDIVLFRFNV